MIPTPIPWFRTIQFLVPVGVCLVMGLGLAMSRYELSTARKMLAESQKQVGAETARADQWAGVAATQSAGIQALADETKRTQAAIAANGMASAAAMSKIERRISSLHTAADALAQRPAGPPETACLRAADTLVAIDWGNIP